MSQYSVQLTTGVILGMINKKREHPKDRFIPPNSQNDILVDGWLLLVYNPTKFLQLTLKIINRVLYHMRI